jgi:hypothetical protein
MSLHSTQNLFLRLCQNEDFEFTHENLSSFADSKTIAHLLRIPKNRQKLYRHLIENSVSDILGTTFPIFFKQIGSEKKRELLNGFLKSHIRSNHYRHIPYEFFDYLTSIAKNLAHPAHWQLADYEFVQYELMFHEDASSPLANDPNLTLDQVHAVFNPTIQLKDYDYPIQDISEETDMTTVKKEKTYHLIYRDPEGFDIRYFTLSADSYNLINIYLSDLNLTVADGLTRFLERNSAEKSDDLTTESLSFLKQLIANNVVLGLAKND